MRKLRIAVWHNLPSGGGKRQLYYHVKGLIERGHHVESWCPDTADQKFLPLSELIEEHVVALKNRDDDSFNNPRRSMKATRMMLQSLEEHCKECAEQINRGDFDIVYANACRFLRTTPIANFVGIPSAIYLGEPYRAFYEAMPELPWIAPRQQPGQTGVARFREMVTNLLALNSIRVQARAELEYARAFDQVLSNSTYSRESILRAYDIDSTVCYLGVDTDYYRPTGEKKEDFVVGLGTIYHGKGVDRAIRAIGAIDASKRPTLVWIGNGASDYDLQRYQELAKRLQVNFVQKVHIPDSEVISLLSRARLMIYTSRLEPFGLAPLEANACCTPVVGIAEGGVRETIQNGSNGYLALNDEPEALAGLMLKLLDDPASAQEMGVAARRHIEARWNLPYGTDNIERILLALEGSKGGKSVLRQKGLHALQPTNDVRLHVEQRELEGKQLSIKGWGFIDDGKGARNSSPFLLIRNGEQSRVVSMKRGKRTDVTTHFGGGVDYDDCGFSLQCPLPEENAEFGVVIVREEKVSVQYI